MKKLIALLLAVVMCLSLVACGGGSSAEKAILGAWKDADSYDVLVFTEDGKITRDDVTMEWWYDKEADRYSLSFFGMTFTFVIEEDENGRYFTIEDLRYYYVENYDPDAMEAEKIASITEGKTELVVGNSYTTANGVDFTFEKAGLSGEEDDIQFDLYFTHEGELEISDEKYESASGWSSFGLGSQMEGSWGNTHRYSGGFEEMSELEQDKEAYGYLCFSIDGEAYFVSIDAFEVIDPADVVPDPTMVEITMDNWQDYFELCEYTEFEENGFGEIEGATTYWTLVNKDEYMVDMENCDVTFEFTCDWDEVKAVVDQDTKSVNYGEVTGHSTSDATVETMENVGQYAGQDTNERYGKYLNAELFNVEDGQVVSVFDRRMTNVNVLRISGTFSYYE